MPEYHKQKGKKSASKRVCSVCIEPISDSARVGLTARTAVQQAAASSALVRLAVAQQTFALRLLF